MTQNDITIVRDVSGVVKLPSTARMTRPFVLRLILQPSSGAV